MRGIFRFIGIATVLLSGVAAAQSWTEWQAHARWCATDRGTANATYLDVCRSEDQYAAIVACMRDANNDQGLRAIQNAGASAVNTFMRPFKDGRCR